MDTTINLPLTKGSRMPSKPDAATFQPPLLAEPLRRTRRNAAALPTGFFYQRDLINAEEEAALVGEIAKLPLKNFQFHGYEGNRRVFAFGYRYDYTRRAVEPADPIPKFLEPVRERVAGFAGREAGEFRQILALEYAHGAAIGWHRDKPEFGIVVGVSLAAPAVLRLRRRVGNRWERASQLVEPRSAYLLSSEARHDWEHSIVEQDVLRYSLTFRTLADQYRMSETLVREDGKPCESRTAGASRGPTSR